MNFISSAGAEMLKIKRTAATRLTIIGALLIPSFILLIYLLNPKEVIKDLSLTPWSMHFNIGAFVLNSFLFPMYVILICSLLVQIEYRNNTWKQVYASPQSMAAIFFSKFLMVHLLILLLYVLFNLFMIITGVMASLLNPDFTFLDKPIDFKHLLKLDLKTYISVLGISAIQFFLSLRFKNPVAAIGIGLALFIAGFIAIQAQWQHVYKIPYAYSLLTMLNLDKPNRPFLENHEINSIIYCITFLTIGFLYMNYRKEKG